MLVVSFIQWWYGPGWHEVADRLVTRLHETYLTFSIPVLIKTLFSPWRKIISYSNSGIQAKFQATLDNLISRVIGFIVRCLAITAALVIIVAYIFIGGLLMILWPIMPILGPILIVGGLL